MDLDGYLRRFVHICAMRGEWLRVTDVVKRHGVHRNTPKNWHDDGKVRMRHGRYSARDIERHLGRKSAGRRPGKKTQQSDLTPHEKELCKPFVQPGTGIRKLKRLIQTLLIYAREVNWSPTKKQRYAALLRAGADELAPVTLTAPASDGLLKQRERERASHSREDKRQWKKRRATVERIQDLPDDVNPRSEQREAFRFYLWLAPQKGWTTAEFNKKVQRVLNATSWQDCLQRIERSGFKMAIREHTSERTKFDQEKQQADDPGYDENIAGEVDDRFLNMSSEGFAAAHAKWRSERPRRPRVQGDLVTRGLIEWIAAQTKWRNDSPTLTTQKKRDKWLLKEIASREDWQWRKIDGGWGWEATPPKRY
jgi:hypothetical protein